MNTRVINIVNNWCYGDGFGIRYSIDVQFDIKTSEDGTIEFFNDKIASRNIIVEKGNSYRESTDKDYIIKATPSKIMALYKKFKHNIDAEEIKRYDEQAIKDAHSEYLSEVFEKAKTSFKKELAILLDKYNMKLELSNYDIYGSTAYLEFEHVPSYRRDTLMLAEEGECVTFK